MSDSRESGLVVVCTYRVRAGREDGFERLLESHSPTLRRLGLITGLPVQTLRRDEAGKPTYVEVFEWTSADAAARASEVPEIIALWEPMAALCESRDGAPGLEFPTYVRVETQT